jgi:hypothetical protein
MMKWKRGEESKAEGASTENNGNAAAYVTVNRDS